MTTRSVFIEHFKRDPLFAYRSKSVPWFARIKCFLGFHDLRFVWKKGIGKMHLCRNCPYRIGFEVRSDGKPYTLKGE